MLYDIFIAHSHKDQDATNQLIDILKCELPGIRIWEDTDEAIPEEEYRSYLTHAINNSTIVIYVLSNVSLEDEYCKVVIYYAKNNERKVIPYQLPFLEDTGWFGIEFRGTEYYHSWDDGEKQKMVHEIKSLLGRSFADRTNSQKCKTQKNLLPQKSVESQFYFDPTFGELKRKDSIDKEGINAALHSEVSEINGHQYVDLGLPSGTKWATCNIGAKKPEQYGDCYSWGETEAKKYYAEDTTATFEKDIEWLKKNGYIQENGNLALSHDVAHEQWGASWRIPTKEDFEELVANTTSQYAVRRGVTGRLIKSKKNNNSIFLPTAGWKFESSRVSEDNYGSYWSSTPNAVNAQAAFTLNIGKYEFALCAESDRAFGHSVRPVSD